MLRQSIKDASQDKKAFLSQYLDTGGEISRIQDEIDHWQSSAGRMSASYGLAGGRGSDGQDRLQIAVEHIVQLQDTLVKQVEGRLKLRQKIEQAIAGVPEPRLRLLLQYRYLDGLCWEKIAAKMQYDSRWVRRLHQKALDKLELESPPWPM